jgi:hypothetical protein
LGERQLKRLGDAAGVAGEEFGARRSFATARTADEPEQVLGARDVARTHVRGSQPERERQVPELLGDERARRQRLDLCRGGRGRGRELRETGLRRCAESRARALCVHRLVCAEVLAADAPEEGERLGHRQAAEHDAHRAVRRRMRRLELLAARD